MQPSLAVVPPPQREARALPLRRLVVAQELASAEGVAAALAEALADPGADTVLLVAAGTAVDPAAIRAALERVAADDAVDVVAWHASDDRDVCRAALLPLDAVRAVGLAHAGLARASIADLVRRAEAAGFLAVEAASGAVVVRPLLPTARDRVLLAMLHEPVAARSRVVRASLAAETRSLLGRRWAEVAVRHRDLAAVLVAVDADERLAATDGGAVPLPGGVLRQALSLHAALWLEWPALRRRARAAALDHGAAAGWSRRFLGVDDDATRGAPASASAGAPRVRWRPWSTTRRATSAA